MLDPSTPDIFAHVMERAGKFGPYTPDPPLQITQDRIDLYAAATGDDQWVHTDPERAAGAPQKVTFAQGGLSAAIIYELKREEMASLAADGLQVIKISETCTYLRPVRVGTALQARGMLTVCKRTANAMKAVYTYEIVDAARSTPDKPHMLVSGDLILRLIAR
ncbi:MAG TPA: MaoC/PaaZ C-terminal domain-containing protein [Candidatus Paceibacterota bacterium]|nr:MaoC/PaaZ C-terminal domain-containing protein [Candidatus Paceibacterota bacterium]